MINCPICLNESEPAGLLRRCGSCDHVFEHPPVVRVQYGRDYLAKYDSYPTREMSLLRVGFLKAFVQSGRLLDVGYGQGTFVKLAIEAGFDAYGADVHGQGYGVREIDLISDSTAWDVVTMFDSLEHFIYPLTLLSLFARARFIVISTPLRPDWFPSPVDPAQPPRDPREWHHFKVGEHLHYWSRNSLDRLVDRKLLTTSNVEDLIRGAGPDGEQNIITNVYAGIGRHEP